MKFQFSPLIGHLRSYIDIKSIADVRNSRYILLSPRAIRPTRRLWAGLLSPARRGPGIYVLPLSHTLYTPPCLRPLQCCQRFREFCNY